MPRATFINTRDKQGAQRAAKRGKAVCILSGPFAGLFTPSPEPQQMQAGRTSGRQRQLRRLNGGRRRLTVLGCVRGVARRWQPRGSCPLGATLVAARLASRAQTRNQRGVDSELSPAPKRETIRDDVYAAVIRSATRFRSRSRAWVATVAPNSWQTRAAARRRGAQETQPRAC